MQGTPAFSV